jgi:hypothetical protein
MPPSCENHSMLVAEQETIYKPIGEKMKKISVIAPW